MLEGITFKRGSAKIDKKSFKALDDAYDILMANPSLKVEIQGHTDITGSLKANTRLSQARAKSVYTYLTKTTKKRKGIDKKRLTFKGYGPSQPKASNDTEEGRAQNRRIEFKVIE